jgi:hypothetical protein
VREPLSADRPELLDLPLPSLDARELPDLPSLSDDIREDRPVLPMDLSVLPMDLSVFCVNRPEFPSLPPADWDEALLSPDLLPGAACLLAVLVFDLCPLLRRAVAVCFMMN